MDLLEEAVDQQQGASDWLDRKIKGGSIVQEEEKKSRKQGQDGVVVHGERECLGMERHRSPGQGINWIWVSGYVLIVPCETGCELKTEKRCGWDLQCLGRSSGLVPGSRTTDLHYSTGTACRYGPSRRWTTPV